MSDTMPVLLLPNGQPITKDHGGNEGRGLRILTTDNRMVLARSDLRGAEPKRWDHTLYLDMYYKHPSVFAAINKIVKTATNTGYDFVTRDSRTRANEEEVRRAKRFFDRQHDFIGELRRIYRDLLIFGDAYLYVVPDRKRRPVKLKRLAPWTIHIKAKRNGKVEYYVQKDIAYGIDEEPIIFQPHEILHFRLDDPGNDLYGLSPLEALKTTITTDLNMLNFQKKFFQNGASTGTFILVEEASDAELMRTRDWIRDEFVGGDNAYKPIIIGGKGIKIERGVASHEEMSFLAGREFLMKQILSVIDVPPAKAGHLETANRSNSKEQDKSFRTETISPLQYTVEAVINDQFMREILGCHDILFEHSESDVRDAQEQMDLWTDAVQNGLMSVNEVRNKMGFADVDGGDEPYVMTPTGAIPISRLDDAADAAIAHQNAKATPGVSTPKPPKPRNPSADATVTGLKPATKSLSNLAVSVQGTAIWLERGRTDDAALRQAYAYAMDAMEATDDWLVAQTAHAIGKALKTDDHDLRLAYLDRAEGFVAQLVQSETEVRDAA